MRRRYCEISSACCVARWRLRRCPNILSLRLQRGRACQAIVPPIVAAVVPPGTAAAVTARSGNTRHASHNTTAINTAAVATSAKGKAADLAADTTRSANVPTAMHARPSSATAETVTLADARTSSGMDTVTVTDTGTSRGVATRRITTNAIRMDTAMAVPAVTLAAAVTRTVKAARGNPGAA